MISLTQKQIVRLKRQLNAEKINLENRLRSSDNFSLSETLREWPIELSTYDNHPADVGTELFEREKDLALNENTEAHLREVIDALARIETNNYGMCDTCHLPIAYKRLEALPETRYCIIHSPEQDISEHRPVEEEVLYPPFGRTSLDEHADQTQFDGEDAWQIVQSWGNSNSPAMSENPEVHSYDDMFIEADENDGYVEAFESFVATDIYGKEVSIVRNKAYREYIANQEGEPLLESEVKED